MSNLGSNETYIVLRATLAQALRELENVHGQQRELSAKGPQGYHDPEYTNEGLRLSKLEMAALRERGSILHVVELVWAEDDPKGVLAQIEREAQIQVEETRD